jgi:hypothetical protein
MRELFSRCCCAMAPLNSRSLQYKEASLGLTASVGGWRSRHKGSFICYFPFNQSATPDYAVGQGLGNRLTR